ncbi:MAG: NUDIX hydrolase, partial [Desulfobacterales bacterium]|nr:NUDIX hydrolase [Desulfobacterales bacterium]
SKQRNLFNGQLLCRYSHKQRGKNLYIQCFFSEYKYFFANINNPELALNFSSVSVSGIILDEKKNTIIGKRNNVTEYKGFYELIPSGSIDADRVRRGSVTFKDQIIEEFEEETGLDRRTIKRIEPICVIFDKTHMVYDICMKISIRGFLHHLLTSDSNREYKQVQIINLENIHTKINIDNMVPTSQVMLNNLLKK